MFTVRIEPGGHEQHDVKSVAAILERGGVGILPTDTVYGIVASALDRKAVSRLLEIKGRAPDKPLPIHVSSAGEADTLAFADGPPQDALMDAFWPGPLTLVMERRPGVDIPLQPAGTLGLRVPDHRFCLEVLRRAGCLVVPSANRTGKPPPVEPAGISVEIMDRVDFFVDGGRCPGGVPSTVVDVTEGLRVLREGAIPADEITRVAGGGAPGD
ncbi:MAG: threonylcarbamoyl-AMP synthase [Actinobacteria bacterium]|nr:threonylcarbamoyl-AMP synthase [Actinomycetota bacterium]